MHDALCRSADSLLLDLSRRSRIAGHFLSKGYQLTSVEAYKPLSVVYKGKCVRNNQRIAVKLVHSEDVHIRKKFAKEVEVLKALRPQRSAVRIHEWGYWEGKPYHISEWVEGNSIDRIIDGAQRLSVQETINITWRTAQSIRHLHENNIVHRDVSPDHVIIRSSGDITLLDFGMAEFIDQQHPQNAWKYTQYDVLSLGLVLCELLMGRSLFSYRDPTLAEQVPAAHKWLANLGLSKRVLEVVTRALAADSEMAFKFALLKAPFRSMLEFERHLRACLKRGGASPLSQGART